MQHYTYLIPWKLRYRTGMEYSIMGSIGSNRVTLRVKLGTDQGQIRDQGPVLALTLGLEFCIFTSVTAWDDACITISIAMSLFVQASRSCPVFSCLLRWQIRFFLLSLPYPSLFWCFSRSPAHLTSSSKRLHFGSRLQSTDSTGETRFKVDWPHSNIPEMKVDTTSTRGMISLVCAARLGRACIVDVGYATLSCIPTRAEDG